MALDPATQRLARLSAAIVIGAWSEVRVLRRAAPPGEPDRAWREAVLQCHLFGGFPRLVEAYAVLAAAGGLGEPEADELETLGAAANAGLERGEALFERIYGPRAGGVREQLTGYHADFATWIATHAYGAVLSRPGLDPARRELCAVAALVATGQDRQLASHARGAVRCGADPGAVRSVPDALEGLVEVGLLERGRVVIERFAKG